MKVLLRLVLLLSVGLWLHATSNGNLDGCNYEMNSVAGQVKRAAFLRNLKPTGPTLILDTGDIFDESPDPDLEGHILKVYGQLG